MHKLKQIPIKYCTLFENLHVNFQPTVNNQLFCWT